MKPTEKLAYHDFLPPTYGPCFGRGRHQQRSEAVLRDDAEQAKVWCQ